jgi:hypothetical protein
LLRASTSGCAYNDGIPHTALDDKIPDEYYFNNFLALPNPEFALTAKLFNPAQSLLTTFAERD